MRPVLKTLSLAMGTALALAACAVGPDYKRPDSPLPARYQAPAGDETQPLAQVESGWWKRFGDPTLDQLVEAALATNADLASAVARMQEAEAAMREAGASLYPELDLELGSTRNRVSTRTATPMPAGTPVLRDNRRAALTTAFELDFWGRIRRLSEAARAQALASRYARDTVALSVSGLISSQYFGLRTLDAQLAAAQDTLASREESARVVENRIRGGVASPLDRNQALSALAAARAQIATLRQSRALAQHQLALLTGQPDLKLDPAPAAALPVPPLPPAGLPSDLLTSRPDIRQAEETLVAANAQIGAARAAYFPKISLTASLGSESKTLADLFSGPANLWSLGLGAVMPLIDAGRTSARVDQATARQQQALAAYRKTVESAFKDVNDALVTLREQTQVESAQAERARAAAESHRIARLRYESGYSTYLTLLDAQRDANDARVAELAARQARLTAAVDLFKALGGGWQDASPRVAASSTPP